MTILMIHMILESKIRERYTVFCRLLDSKTKFMLEKQIYRPRATWICPTPKCQRAQISEWETTCRDCQGRRPRWIYDIIGGAEIRPSDWICSMYVDRILLITLINCVVDV